VQVQNFDMLCFGRFWIKCNIFKMCTFAEFGILPKIRLRNWDIILKYNIINKDNYKIHTNQLSKGCFLRNLENDVNFSMTMTSDRKLLLISFVKLLQLCKNQFSKCCSFAEFKKWHQFLCEDDRWSKIVTNKFVRLVY